MSSRIARRGRDVDPIQFQCAHDVLALSHSPRAVGRSRYFILRHMSSVGRLLAHARNDAGISRQLQSRKASESYLQRMSPGAPGPTATPANDDTRTAESSRDWSRAKLYD